jgi:hypothetical protein
VPKLQPDGGRLADATAWTRRRPGCGCGRPTCAGCPLTARTVFVLQSEMAWLADLAEEDVAAVRLGHRLVADTVLADLPAPALRRALTQPAWLRRFRSAVAAYVDRLDWPGPVDPCSPAEEVALRMAFAAARTELDPDELFPPTVAAALPPRPGDYAWRRAAAEVRWTMAAGRLYNAGDEPAAPDPLDPDRWFDPA